MPTPVRFKISSSAEADRETLNAVAELPFRAWGRDGRPEEVDQPMRNLQAEIAALNPDSKAMFVASIRDGVVGFVKTGSDHACRHLPGHPEDRRGLPEGHPRANCEGIEKGGC